MNRLVFVILIVLLLPSTPTLAQSPVLRSTEQPQYLWRADSSQFTIEEAQIFPQIELSPSGSLERLGSAWLAWTLNISGALVPYFGTYEQGQLNNINNFGSAYQEIEWFGLEDILIMIGVVNNQTEIHFKFSNGESYKYDIPGATTNHELYLSQSGTILLFADNTGIGQAMYYSQQNLQIVGTPTTERMITGGLGGAVIQQSSGERVFVTDTGNVSIPETISTNLQIGHLQFTPVIFDLGNNQIWSPFSGIIDFPTDGLDMGYFGLGSSIIFGEHRMYEFTIESGWLEIARFDKMPLDYSLVDVGLYVGTIPHAGLGLVSSGLDADKDGVPDTMEDYFGSLSTTSDTDNDGIKDSAEILSGTDPAVPDADADPDNDRLPNLREIQLGLDPQNADSDYGGALDGWEVEFGLNTTNPADDTLDPDSDGATNAQESLWGSDPRNPDTDGDRIPDGWEIEHGIDPTIANADEDPDQDQRSNWEEYRGDTDPLIRDPRPLFDNLWIETGIILLMTLPVAILMWRKYTPESV